MDVPVAIHVVDGNVETIGPRHSRLDLQGRSLRNTLGIIKKRIREMKEKEIYTIEDVEHYKFVLEHLEERWRNEQGTFAGELKKIDAPLAAQCSKLWSDCYSLITSMEEEAFEMPNDVRAIHSKLADVHRQLQELAERSHTNQEVAAIVHQLNEIDAIRQDNGGVFSGDIESPSPGNPVCLEILNQSYELARQAAKTATDEPDELKSVSDTLRGIRNQLRKLMGQKHHTVEDVAHYRFLLMALLSAKAEYSEEWEASTAKPLAEECLAMVEKLEGTAEPMSPEMKSVYERLRALKKDLTIAVSTSGRPSNSDLDKWMHEASGIDEERAQHDGIFGLRVSNEEDEKQHGGLLAPPGQASCHHLLQDCFSLLQELFAR